MDVLVVGGGSIGERHVRCFLATNRARVSVCEIDPDVRRRLNSQYSLARAYASLEEAIAARHDVAVVAVPAQLHVAMARQLVAAGCHVLIEKPLSTSHDDVADLACEAAARQAIVGVAYVHRHNPGLVALRDEVRSGRHGPPLEIVHVGGQDFARLRPAYREIYYRDHRTGGGAVQDALTHMINAAEWTVGPVTSVAADAAHVALEGVDVEDTVHVAARHGDIPAVYALNQHQPPNESTLTVHCRDATLRWQLPSGRTTVMRRGETEWVTLSDERPDRDAGFIAQADAFLEAVAARQPPRCTLSEASQTLAACLTILEAARTGRWLDVPDMSLAREPR